MEESKKALLGIHSSVVIFGLTALFSRLIDLPALEITFLRSIFAALMIWGYLRWQGESLQLNDFRSYAVVVLLGILLAAHWVTYFHAMQVASIAVGVIALFTFPIMTVFIEPLFHGERPHFPDVISALAVFYGIYLLMPEFNLNDTTSQGVMWGLLSALLYALRNIIQRRFFSQYSARHALFYQSMVVMLVLLPFAVEVIVDVTVWQWGQLLVLGVFFTALPHVLFAHSLLHFKAKTASLISCLQVLYSTLFAAILLAEIPDLLTVAGGLIIIAAAMFESYAVGRAKNAR